MAETATVDRIDIQVSSSANATASAFEELSEKLDGISSKLSALTNIVKKQSRAASSHANSTKKVSSAIRNLSATADKAQKSLSGVTRAIGRIAFYRAIRSAIKAVSSAVKEGLTNLKAYSEQVGTAFAPAVDNLRRHVLLLKNAFATALRPVIEALIPVIINLVNWFAKAADFIAQVLSLLTGKVDANGRYTKAVLSDLQESNKQAKELRRTLLGFDEINRLDGNTGSGESSNAGLMFTQAEPSEEAKGWAEKLQVIIDKIKEIASAVKKFIDDNPWILKVAGVMLAAVSASKLLSGAFTAILGALKAILNPATLFLAFLAASALYGDKIKKKSRDIKKVVDDFFKGLKGHRATLDGIIDFVQRIADFVITNIGLLAGAIRKFVKGDFDGAKRDIIQIGKNALKFLLGLIVDAVNIFLGILSDILYNIGLVVTKIHNKIALFIENVKIFFHNLWADIKIGFFTFLRVIIVAFDNVVQVAVGIVNGMIDTFNTVTNSNIKPIEVNIDTTVFDEKIEQIEATKLDPLTEEVDFKGKWREPERLKLHWDVTGINQAIDNIGTKVNRLGNAVASVASAVGLTSGKDIRSRLNIQKYASGGFPSVGSLFWAGEGGRPELVASVGGQTGVWNSDQLVRALYAAFTSALATMPQGGGDIYLDGEVIYRNVVNRNNNRVRSVGRSALLT